MQTSSTNFSCDTFKEDQTNKVIRGKYFCQGGVAKPSGAGHTPTGSGSKPTGSSAAGHMDVNYPAVLGGTSVLAGLLQLLL